MKLIIDLSLPIKNNTPEPESPKIKYLSHVDGAKHLCSAAMTLLGMDKENQENNPVLTEHDFPDSMGLANEDLELDTHAGTHLDAPWHFGPKSGNKQSLTIDKLPLEWCYSNGVRLDFTHKSPGELITKEDVILALKKIQYQLNPMDIVLIMTGADKHFHMKDYFSAHPGMSPEATIYILEQDIKILGIDAWGFDRPGMSMIKDYLKARDKNYLFPSHFVGRKIEYCHMEKLANLDKIPKDHGFIVSCLPVKIENAGAAWCRAVAII